MSFLSRGQKEKKRIDYGGLFFAAFVCFLLIRLIRLILLILVLVLVLMLVLKHLCLTTLLRPPPPPPHTHSPCSNHIKLNLRLDPLQYHIDTASGYGPGSGSGSGSGQHPSSGTATSSSSAAAASSTGARGGGAGGSGGVVGTAPYETANLIVRRRGRENNFRAVLETLRDLIRSGEAGSIEANSEIPDWLVGAILGLGAPDRAVPR